MYLSHFVDGGVAEVATDGSNAERVLVPKGLVGPWGIACGTAGQLYLNDGLSLAVISPTKEVSRLGGLLDNSFPGFVRSLAAGVPGELWLTTMAGDVVQFFPDGRPFNLLARKLQEPYGVTPVGGGAVVVAEKRSGKLLHIDAAGQVSPAASGLSHPGEVVAASDGTLFVSDMGAGRIATVEKGGNPTTLIDGLSHPSGLAWLRQDTLLVLDRGTKELHAVNINTKQRQTLATALPVGDPPGCSRGPMEFSGGLAVAPDGTVYIAGDGEGSVLALRSLA